MTPERVEKLLNGGNAADRPKPVPGFDLSDPKKAKAKPDPTPNEATDDSEAAPTIDRPTFPEPDSNQLEIYIEALFRHCDLSGVASLRSFDQNDRSKPPRVMPIPLKNGLKFLMEAAEKGARRAANDPIPMVFAPPVATFTNTKHAREEDLFEGPVLSVDLDQNPRAGLATLERLLGPATLVVCSGGQWTNPTTGEVEDKLHVYWRLKEPARGEDLKKLKELRRLATELVGGDPSNISIVHPIRWAGSWHRKGTPRLCEIVSTEHIDNEIDLDVAFAALEDVTPQSDRSGEFNLTQKASSNDDNEDPARFKVAEGFEEIPFERLGGNRYPETAEPDRIAVALAVIPNSKRLLVLRGQKTDGSENDPLDWHTWNTIGLATWRGTNGSAEGGAVFLTWSRTWPKYIAATKAEKAHFDRNTAERWKAFSKCPPTKIGVGTIFWLADQISPGWREEYEDHQDEGDTQPEKSEASKASLPKLIINSSDPTATAKDLAALIAKRDDFLFNGNAPIHVVAEANYSPRALEVTTEMVRVLAHEICVPVKQQKKKIRGKVEVVSTPAPLSNDIAQLYLHGLEGSWGLKPFNGITTAPILSNDGSIRTASGYDVRSKLWCYNIPDITVPIKPTTDDAKQALRVLREFFRTFPFADAARLRDRTLGVDIVDLTKGPGLDESSFLAALMTSVCRQSLELAPGYLCDAPNFSGSGTGKGLLVKATCTTAAGFTPAAFTSGHDAEELDKRLTSVLISAPPAAFLDNFNNKNLTSDVLASALTENPATVRPFGQTKMIPLFTRTYIGITGNAVQIAEDMARRLLNTHLDARMENPEQRKFAPGFLDHIFAERTKLLTAALTIWRWGRQNKLTQGKPLGSYEVWAQWCRDPLLELGTRDPVDRIDEIKAADPKRRSLIAIFDQWWNSDADAVLKASELADEVIKLIDDKAFVKTDGSLQYSRQRVASFLAKHTDTRVGGHVLTKITQGPASKKTAHYKLSQPGPE
jgi:hypothetical protein